MAGERLTNTDPADNAQAAGLRHTPTLDDVDKRRYQLFSISLFVVVALTVAIAVLSLGRRFLPESLQIEATASWIIAVLVAGLAFAFLIYVLEKERYLRRLRDQLVEERVLSAALSNRLTEISTLSEVGKAINTTLNLEDVLNLILSSALELLGGTEGSVMLLNESGRELEVVIYHGPRREAVMNGRTKIGHGISGQVAQDRTPLLMQGDELQGSLKGAGYPERGIKSSMSVPLLRRDELLGVLNLSESVGKRRFTEGDLSALGLFAENAAIALGNARLYEQEKETVGRLEELDRMKSDFLATVSHELKTPLTSIIGAAKTLGRKFGTMDDPQKLAFLEMIERQGNHLMRMVEDVLTAAKIEHGVGKMRRELIDLRLLAEQVIEDLGHAPVGTNRTITLECDPDRPQVWGDLRSVQQILTNLTENALKYSDGPVVLRTIETPKEARLEVSDQGPGMDEDQVKLIFDRFQQIDSSSTRSVGGVGLGLFIVKNLAESLNGSIAVDSRPGEGTTFSVTLPKRSRDQG